MMTPLLGPNTPAGLPKPDSYVMTSVAAPPAAEMSLGGNGFAASVDRVRFGNKPSGVAKGDGFSTSDRLKAALRGAMSETFRPRALISSVMLSSLITAVFALIPPHIHAPLAIFPSLLAVDLLFRAWRGGSTGWDHPERFVAQGVSSEKLDDKTIPSNEGSSGPRKTDD